MGSWGFAPIVTKLTLTGDGVPTKLLGGATCKVWGFVICNTGTTATGVVNITSQDGTVVYYKHLLASGETIVVDTKFVADAGIAAFVTGANFAEIAISFFHGNIE